VIDDYNDTILSEHRALTYAIGRISLQSRWNHLSQGKMLDLLTSSSQRDRDNIFCDKDLWINLESVLGVQQDQNMGDIVYGGTLFESRL